VKEPAEENRAPGRPRDPRVDTAVAAATLELLAEAGYAGLTVDHIAQRAGVGKAGVYRRWPDKESVVLAALTLGEQRPAAPDTGGLHGDLIAFLTALVRYRAEHLDAVAAVSSEALTSERIGTAFRESVVGPVRDAVLGILERAVARGELSPTADLELLVSVPVALLFTRRLLSGRHPDEDFVRRVAAQMVAAAAGTGGTP
jgi:AcrR family transcriptional regulator